MYTSTANAKLIKYAANAILETSVSFNNEIADIADGTVDTNINFAMERLRADKHFSYHRAGETEYAEIVSYLRAGCKFRDSCLPKNVQALSGKSITIFSDGSQTRSFCYVDDLVDALIKFMGTPDSMTGPMNIGSPEEITIAELAELVIRMTGSSSKIEFRSLPPDDPVQRCPDISYATQALMWAPTTSLAVGLKKIIDFFYEKNVIASSFSVRTCGYTFLNC